MQRIPFRSLPDFSLLFCDYVDGAPAATQFFHGSPRRPEDAVAQIERVQSRYYPREALVPLLTAQNKALHAGSKTFANIDALGDAKTVAVVTGQQVGLFGGPLYTIYKTLTTIRLCKELRKWHRNTTFVPVFWLETEDHDFAEANHTTFLDETGAPATFEYTPAIPPDDNAPNRGAVGKLTFDDGIDAVIAALEEKLPKTEFHPAVMKLLRKCYKPGVDFGTAFGMLMHALFHDDGLVLVNPLDPAVKRLLAPVFRRELETSPRVSEAIISRTAEIEEMYHAQVKARTINLFMLWKGGRYGIDPRRDHGDYWLKGTRQYFSKEELMTMLEKEPERFSPNVVLRPICQDFLFPTVMYVGGPGEIAYFAQFKGAYDAFEMPMPVIYPRASVTLVEQRFATQLERLSMGLGEYLHNPAEAVQKIVQAQSAVNLDELFAHSRATIEGAFDTLQTSIERIDKTLLGALTNAKEKTGQSLDVLAKKTMDAAVRGNETVTRQMDKLKASLYPNDVLQERALNILYFLNKYGMEFLPAIAERISVDTFEHQALKIDGAVKKAEAAQQSLF